MNSELEEADLLEPADEVEEEAVSAARRLFQIVIIVLAAVTIINLSCLLGVIF